MSDADFPIEDRVGAWVPHGRFVLAGASRGALAGLDFAVKDVFDVGGHPTGAGNPEWLATHAVPQTSNPVVERLLAAGATMMGKVLTDELAYSLHGDNAHYGAPINPAAPERVTGGSSSGSAAAVAARLVDFALGTDTGGSTRIPASYCGLWGLRTTHGLLSTRGMVALHPSYDTVTWLAAEAEVFERVGAALLPLTEYAPHHVMVLDDARGLADTVFARPLARVVQALEKGLATIASFRSIADGAELESWRQTYATSGAWEAWQTHGEWISTHEPDFGAAVGARFRAASGVTEAAAEAARTEAARIRRRCAKRSAATGSPCCPRPRASRRGAMPMPSRSTRCACAPWRSPASPGSRGCRK